MPVISQNIDMLKKSFNQSANTYDSDTDTLAGKVNDFVNKYHILNHLNNNNVNSILDAGGGTGKFAIPLSEMGYDVTLIDISPSSIEIAKQKAFSCKTKLTIVEGNVESLNIDSNHFDFILSQGPLSYTPNPVEMIKEMYRVLKPQGTIWIDFYNSLGWAMETDNISFKMDLSLSEEKLIQMSDWDYPARVFSINHVIKLLTEVGFKIIKIYGNHILLNSLPLDHIYSQKYDINELEKLQQIELRLSESENCIGVSKNCQILAIK